MPEPTLANDLLDRVAEAEQQRDRYAAILSATANALHLGDVDDLNALPAAAAANYDAARNLRTQLDRALLTLADLRANEEQRARIWAAAPSTGSRARAQGQDTVRALRTGLDHAITYLTATHRHHGLHDGRTPCEGCEVLGDLEQIAAAVRRDDRADPVDPAMDKVWEREAALLEADRAQSTPADRAQELCCDLHNQHCEPSADLCCPRCTEATHPDHRPGERCVLRLPDPDADRAQDVRPAAWEQQATDTVRAALADTWPHLGAGAVAEVAVRAIIDAGLAGPGGRCRECGQEFPRTLPAGQDPLCWTCCTEEVVGLPEYANPARDTAQPATIAAEPPADPTEGHREDDTGPEAHKAAETVEPDWACCEHGVSLDDECRPCLVDTYGADAVRAEPCPVHAITLPGCPHPHPRDTYLAAVHAEQAEG